MKLRRFAAIASLTIAACGSPADKKQESVRPPRLANREEILRQRQAIADSLLAPGDSILVPVYIYVDTLGMPRQPEVKSAVPPRIAEAAIALVRNMRFNPATRDGQPTIVMLTVPVKLVRR